MKITQAIKSGHPGSLFSAFLYFDISFMVWVILGPLAVYIAQDMGLSAAQKGALVAFPILGGALLRIPMGILTDRFGPRRTGLAGLVITLVPLIYGWLWADSLGHVMAVGLLLGVAGASFAVALPLASRWYPPEHQGVAMGVAGAGNSGTVLTMLLAPRLAEHVGWQGVIGLAAIPISITFALFFFLAKESPNQPAPRSAREYLSVFMNRDAWWFNFFYGVTFGGFVGLASFLVIFFHDQYGLAKVMAGNFAAACVFAGSFFRPIGGYLSDRFGGVRVLTGLFVWVGVMMFGISLLPPLPVVTVLLFAGMMGLGMGNGSVFQIVPQRFGKEIGIVTGMVGAAGGFGGFLLPMFFGVLKDLTGSFKFGFILFGIIGFLSFISLQLVHQKYWRWAWMTSERPVSGLSPSGRVAMEVVFGG
ncbi:MAG: NarK/NasA family nitrate transporter [Nitrospirae bacterium]|nr:NarK/NasA family nitrate transporter [Nitrospirota bacterium]